MTSSMLAGERRWVSARRGGMTVLGKVAVPKPLNLPSQRLENHGLDPNVDIVPKGTLSWGSRSSSCASNAWGSSTLSPNADGGTRSPSQLSGRPSSGNGTRPSTAGSDRVHEPTSNAWGQNSRPSSASEAFTSNQTVLTALRPGSAETRPGSSQLSRFAEPSSDNSVAWGPTAISEKLGVASSKNDGFSLSSVDFPTLGSERENSGKITDIQDHGSYGHTGSSSGSATSEKEKNVTSSVGDISVNINVKSGTVNPWRRDGFHVEDGVQPFIEKGHGDPPPYLNANVPPEHFDAWHGPPMNPPLGVWYRGPSVGPPYGTPFAPGFSIVPFPYYRPQIPPTALANSQPVPLPGTEPIGHHPKNGDLYRPHIPDAYICPNRPIRPGFYPGPMAYEGYYGAPMHYCDSNKRDIPVIGMAAGPSVYNRYLGESALDPSNNYARARIHGSVGRTLVSEQVESGHCDDSRGPYKVLLKQHNERDERGEEDKWENVVLANGQYLEKGDGPRNSSEEHEWGLEDRKGEEIYSGRTFGGDSCSPNFENRGSCSSDSIKVMLPESKGKVKAVYDSPVNKSENAASTFPQAPQVFPAGPRNPRLIQKNEGLNSKSRASDGQPDAASIPCREEQKSRLREVDAMANCSASEAGNGAVCLERTHTIGTLTSSYHEWDISTADKTLMAAASSATAFSRRASHFGRGRLDRHGKRFNAQDADGWRKKPLAGESIEFSGANSERSFSVHVRDRLTPVEAAEKSGNNLQGNNEGEFLAPMFDASDCQVQEIVRQHPKQLQAEEGEWMGEQKAKALAKLEDLNWRIQTTNVSTLKLENAPCSRPIRQEVEESGTASEPAMVASSSKTPSSALVSYPNSQLRECSSIKVGESSVMSKDTLVETPDNVHPESDVSHGQPLPLKKDARTADADNCTAAPQVNEGCVSGHKHMGYKKKQKIPLGKTLTERSALIGPTEASKDWIDVAINDVAYTVVAGDVGLSGESGLAMNSNIMERSSAHQRRKNNRSSKNKHKLDNASSTAPLPSTVSKETNTSKVPTEGGKSKSSELDLDPSSVQSRAVAQHAIQLSEQRPYFPSEEAGGKVNNQWKSQHSHRVQRNQQTNIVAEKLHYSDAVIWAPVGSRDKSKVMDEAGNTIVPDIATAMAKSENVMQNNMKSKRAEVERYIPKPVAKELAQSGSIQQSVPSSANETASHNAVGVAELFENDESSQPGHSATGSIRSTSEFRGKQTKLSKTNGSWRQRRSVESAAQVLQDKSSPTSTPRKNVQKSIEQYHSLRLDISSLKEQLKSLDDWNTSDGCTPANSKTIEPDTSAAVKDRGVAGRGKQHPFKGHRSMGNNHDLDHGNSNSADPDETSCQPPGSEIGQTDKNIASRENRGVGELVSQWTPKSQVHSFHNQLGNKNTIELAPPAIVNTQPELQFSSGSRKNDNHQNNRSGRRHESREVWSSAGQDNRQHNTHSSQERQRYNSRYEYQPIGKYTNNKSNRFEGPTDGSHKMGSRYEERSRGYSSRGKDNLYARHSGTVSGDANYD